MSHAGSTRSERVRHWDVFLLGSVFWWLLLCAAWAVRLWQLDASDLTFDEAATYFVAHRPLPDILAYLRGAVREHPPVYYLLIRLWMGLAGSSEYSLRFFAVCASMIGITLTARLGRKVARQLWAIDVGTLFPAITLPALILAAFPFEVYYARDARMYTLTIVWAVLSSLLFWPLLFDLRQNEWPRVGWLAGLVLVNSLAVFTHLYLVLLVISQFVILLLLRRWRASLAWGASHGAIALVGAIWVARSPGLFSSLTEAWGRFSATLPTMNQIRRLFADLLFGPIRGVPWELVFGSGVLVILGVLVIWLRFSRASDRDQRRRRAAVGVWMTVTIFLPVALAYLMPEPPRSRYLIYVLPFAAIAIGQVPLIFSGRNAVILVWLGLSVVTILSLGFFGLPRTVSWEKSNYGKTITTVSAHDRPGDGVLFYGPWQVISYHYYGSEDFPPITRLPFNAPPQLIPEEAEPVLGELLDTYQRLWVIPAAVDDVDPNHFVAGWLDAFAHPVWASDTLSLYLPPPDHEAIAADAELEFGGRLRLERTTGDAQAVPAGDSLRLTLTWAVLETLDADLKLDFSLLDEWGNRWLQWHRVPGRWRTPPSRWEEGDVITDRQGLIVPQGAPPGRYTVQLAVVDAESDEPLWPTRADGSLAKAGVEVLSFEVVEPVSPPVLTDVGEFVGPFLFEPLEETTEGLTLAGYELGGLRFTQGNPIGLRLHWLAPEVPPSGLEIRLQLLRQFPHGRLGGQASALVTETLPLVEGYPSTEWTSGRLVTLPTTLSIPSNAPPGRTDLTLSIVDPDGEPWTVAGDQQLTLARLTIEERPTLKELPADLDPVQVHFASDDNVDWIDLRGYRVDGEARPGGRLELTYGWQALSDPSRVYAVFNHLLTTDGQHIAQADGWPQGGMVLTNQWREGEFIRDSHTLKIPADAPPGPYLVLVGLYDASNGERLPASLDGRPLPDNQWQLIIGNEQGE